MGAASSSESESPCKAAGRERIDEVDFNAFDFDLPAPPKEKPAGFEEDVGVEAGDLVVGVEADFLLPRDIVKGFDIVKMG